MPAGNRGENKEL